MEPQKSIILQMPKFKRNETTILNGEHKKETRVHILLNLNQ
jgi:hypothetical protein